MKKKPSQTPEVEVHGLYLWKVKADPDGGAKNFWITTRTGSPANAVSKTLHFLRSKFPGVKKPTIRSMETKGTLDA